MTPTREGPAWPERPPERLEQRISVERDGTIIARSGKVEYGQGIRTGFAMLVAEELAVPVDRVRVELGETDVVPWDMGTFGSMSTATDGALLRAAAAYARSLLLDRASATLGESRDDLTLRDGGIVAPSGRAVSYVELTRAEPLGGTVPPGPVEPRLPRPMADAPRRLEALDIVVGRARYAADVRLPGMLRGHVLHPPSAAARLATVDDATARAMPGVVAVVHDGDVIGVVAERDDQALAAIESLVVTWNASNGRPAEDSHLTLRRDAGVDEAFDGAAIVLEATYHLPYIAHGSIGPSAAVADVRADDADLYVATQRPFGLRDAAAELLGLSPDRVHVHPQAMGGLYGRGNMSDAPLDAVRLSRAVGRPVLVQWTRTEEFRLSPHRPRLDARIRGALDADGRIIGWWYEAWTNPHTYGGAGGPPRMIEMTSGRNAIPPYALGAARVLLHVTPGAVRTGAFRSLAAAPHVFAAESFIDELAHASGQDPIAFRERHAEDPRLRHVLAMVRDRSDWAHRPRDPSRGFGVACAVYHGTYVAEVAEVAVSPGELDRVERVWCAVDAGRLVHVDGARNQIEGGVQQAASWTALESLQVEYGQVTTASWRDYPIATASHAPRSIDVEFVDDPARASTGVGEPGSVPTAAAIANALFAASGVRVRQLPLTARNIRDAAAEVAGESAAERSAAGPSRLG